MCECVCLYQEIPWALFTYFSRQLNTQFLPCPDLLPSCPPCCVCVCLDLKIPWELFTCFSRQHNTQFLPCPALLPPPCRVCVFRSKGTLGALHLFFQTASLIGLELTKKTRLAGQWVPGIHPSLPPQHYDYKHPHAPLFNVDFGGWTSVYKHLYNLTIFPVPHSLWFLSNF